MNQELAEELHRRAEKDKAARYLALESRDDTEMCRIDAENTAWLERVVAEHGWPGTSIVGERGAEAAWLLAQHADLSPAFQRRALELMKIAVATGEASARRLAYLTDRVLVAADEPQMYGTQYTNEPDGSNLRPQPVADPERLDERRAAMGLEPAAEYDRRMRSQHLHLPESSGSPGELPEEGAEPLSRRDSRR
jgi:hypothetical protein